MVGAALAILLAIAVQGGGQPPAGALSADDPDAAAARGMLGAFAYGCVQRAATATSAADYAAGAAEISRQTTAQLPPEVLAHLHMDGVHGDTCQVTYKGRLADALWPGLTDFTRNRMNTVCVEGAASPTRVSIRCAASSHNPAYEERIERDGDNLTASFTWLGAGAP